MLPPCAKRWHACEVLVAPEMARSPASHACLLRLHRVLPDRQVADHSTTARLDAMARATVAGCSACTHELAGAVQFVFMLVESFDPWHEFPIGSLTSQPVATASSTCPRWQSPVAAFQ